MNLIENFFYEFKCFSNWVNFNLVLLLLLIIKYFKKLFIKFIGLFNI